MHPSADLFNFGQELGGLQPLSFALRPALSIARAIHPAAYKDQGW
jgi:hypothetical protein